MEQVLSDPLPLGSPACTDHKQHSPSLSDVSTEAAAPPASHYDEEVIILATNTPKKRTGRRIFKETRHPIFRGVRTRNNNKWVCEMREPNKKSRIWLGTYPSLEMAARAHDVAALAFRGKSACLNFADSAWRLPMPVSNDAKEIRRAASEAAELFRPGEMGSSKEEDGGEVCSCECKSVEEKEEYVDEEALFNMPALLANMAEGLLLSPPHWDDANNSVDVSLWNHSD